MKAGNEKVADIVQHIKQDGFCIIREVIPYEVVDSVRESVEATALAQGRELGVDNKLNQQGLISERYAYGPTYGLLSYNQSFAPYLADDRIISTLKSFWGPHVRITWIIGEFNPPGYKRGGWHSDQPFNQGAALKIDAPYGDAVIHLSSVWMLSPFTKNTGATYAAPGSHRSSNNPTGNNGIDRNCPYPTEIQALGNAGDVFLFDSRLWHASGTNNSNETRFGMAVRYAPWWFNLDYLLPNSEPEKHRLSKETGVVLGEGEPTIPQEIYETLPEDLKPLVFHSVR